MPVQNSVNSQLKDWLADQNDESRATADLLKNMVK